MLKKQGETLSDSSDSRSELPQSMDPRISIITLGVRDVKASTKFYRDGLGLPLSSHSNEHISFFELKGAWLALYGWDQLAEDANASGKADGFSGVTLAHIVHTKEEVRELLTLAASSGGAIVKPAEDTSWGGYSGYFSDLDGHLWEIAWNPHFQI